MEQSTQHPQSTQNARKHANHNFNRVYLDPALVRSLMYCAAEQDMGVDAPLRGLITWKGIAHNILIAEMTRRGHYPPRDSIAEVIGEKKDPE
jgi:hypothetical protein